MLKRILFYIIPVVVIVGLYIIISNNKSDTMDNTKKYPFPLVNTKKHYQAEINTTEGKIVVNLNTESTPITVSNFIYLSKKDFIITLFFIVLLKDL